MVPNILTRHEMAHKMFSVAIPCPSGQKSKMAANFKLAGQFLGFIFISIELTENWEKNSERVWKMLHFLFFNYSVAQKLWILDQNIGRGRHAKWRFGQFFWPFLLKKCNFEQKFEKMQNRNCYFFQFYFRVHTHFYRKIA